MRRGIVGIDMRPGAMAAAPESGVQLGRGPDGPMSVRLFRITGTRVVVAARLLPAQLLAVRAAAAGVTVQIVTSRPQLWQPLSAGVAQCRVLPDAAGLSLPGGPALVVDDRPGEGHPPIEVRPWQCRVDVRSQWSPAELSGFARYDLTILAAIAPEATRLVAATYGLSRAAAEPLSRLDATSFAALRRGALDLVSLDPDAAEAQLLEPAPAR